VNGTTRMSPETVATFGRRIAWAADLFYRESHGYSLADADLGTRFEELARVSTMYLDEYTGHRLAPEWDLVERAGCYGDLVGRLVNEAIEHLEAGTASVR
jgi:hypothetical protein